MSDSTSYSDGLDEPDRRRDADVGLRRPLSPSPPLTRTPNDSLDHPPDHGSIATRRRSHKRDRDRHSASRDFLRMLMNMNEESESKQSRTLLRTALAKLDTETQRAKEAEGRALELAARFKVVNDARVATQQELNRVHEELRLYKVQYDNAQREISRGQDILQDLEAQRNDAEAVAARARTETRKLREEKLVYQAREEGRLEGYNEGLRRGLEQARYERLREEDEHGQGASRRRESSLEDLTMNNLPSPTANGPSLVSPKPQHPIMPMSEQPASRFHEHGLGSTPPPGPPDDQGWPEENETPKFIRPTSMFDPPPERHVPPDVWIPPTDSNDHVQVPPPFALDHTPRSSSQPLPIPPPGQTTPIQSEPVARGYASSLDSVPSIQSTTFSGFDIVANPPGRLSVIRETSVEYSPDSHSQTMPEAIGFPTGTAHHDGGWGAHEESEGTRTPRSQRSRRLQPIEYEDRDRTSAPFIASQPPLDPRPVFPNANTPVLPAHSESQPPPARGFGPHVPPPPPPMVSDLDPNMLAPHSRPTSAAPSRQSSRSRSGRSYNSHDDSDINIEVQPPSGTPTASSPHTPHSQNASLLSPSRPPPPLPTMPSPRSQPILVPTEPSSPSLPRYPSMGNIFPDTSGNRPMDRPGSRSGTAPISGPPPGFVALGVPTPLASSSNLPPMQSTPRVARSSMYSNPSQPSFPRRPNSSSSTSSDTDIAPSGHGRSRSESLRPNVPGIIIKPPSSGSSSSKGSRPSLYAGAPVAPAQHTVTFPPAAPSARFSPRSANSGALPSGHFRSLSLDAGNTPGFSSRPLSTTPAPELRRTPSNASDGSAGSQASSLRKGYGHYKPNEYLDAAYLASSEDLTTNVLSPNTMANTRANAVTRSQTNIPNVLRPGGTSPALSYASLKR